MRKIQYSGTLKINAGDSILSLAFVINMICGSELILFSLFSRGAVGKELTVSGSVLVVCWRAEDCRLLRISIVNFLDQLSLVMRTMQRFGPSVAR